MNNNTNTEVLVEDRNTVTLKEAAEFIAANPKNRTNLIGEPGIGKTSLAAEISRITGYPYFIVDVASMSMGDGCIPVPDYETKTLTYFPNSKFGLHLGEPCIIILDEFSKGDDEVKGTFHPLLETKDSRLGDLSTPEGSIIVMTGNLDSDGVGDNILAHTKMRITTMEVAKPTADEWLLWAAANGISPIVMGWVNRTQDCLASYLDQGQENNPYIFNPFKVQGAIVTPRTLELASNIVKNRDRYSVNALKVALIGTIGAAATNSLLQFIAHHESMTPWSEILANPKTAKLPPTSGACAVLIYSAVEMITDKGQLDAFMIYISREEIDPEFQVIFGISMGGPDATRINKALCGNSDQFGIWAVRNQDLL